MTDSLLRNYLMRCLACNIDLSDYEATRKDKHGCFIDLCNACYSSGSADLEDTVRLDLIGEADIAYEENSSSEYLSDDLY
jgi:hypothetical protein